MLDFRTKKDLRDDINSVAVLLKVEHVSEGLGRLVKIVSWAPPTEVQIE